MVPLSGFYRDQMTRVLSRFTAPEKFRAANCVTNTRCRGK